MKKIKNGYLHQPGYHCFGCCPTNPSGLHMEFFEDGDDIVSLWTPRHDFQGWVGVLHGGIQATLCDEIASWVVFRKLQTTGVTAKLEMRYMKSIAIDEPQLTLRAHLLAVRRNLADIEATIHTSDGTLCAKMTCTYFLQSPEQAHNGGFRPFELEEQ